MLAINLRKLRCEFGDVVAVRDIDLQIPAGELFFMLGPSGCGKTTILRMIAGFQEPTSGQVFFGNHDVTQVPAEKRNAGMVFQSYALWPHMSVFDNVAFGLQVRKVQSTEVKQRVMEALEMVRMAGLSERRPNQLSGGQQQRVALARAIVFRPGVLLLDEPLSNLDAKLRLEMRSEIRRICSEIKLTAVYVTHDQKEALSLADSMVVLRDGRIEQLGGARELYHRPRNRFVAEFLGETNFIAGVVGSSDPAGCMVETAVGCLQCSTGGLATGTHVAIHIRPESLRIVNEPAMLQGRCRETVYLGEMAQHQVETATGIVKVFELDPRTTTRKDQTLHLKADCDALTALVD